MKTFLTICVILLVIDVVALNLMVAYLLDSLENIDKRLRFMEYMEPKRIGALQDTAHRLVVKVNKILRILE